jgi:copper oxidase (laccase) domain-containing protein
LSAADVMAPSEQDPALLLPEACTVRFPSTGSRSVEEPGVYVDSAAAEMGLLVAFSNRLGGTSSPPFSSLNLSVKVGDQAERVVENRRRVALAAGFDVEHLVLAPQAHGTRIRRVGPGRRRFGAAVDGFVTTEPESILALLTADCSAVILATDEAVAMVHAGWRGLAAGIIDRSLNTLGPVRRAWIGPGIRACCYEVGSEVVRAFSSVRLPVGRGRVDIPLAAELALRRAEIGRAHV